MIHPDSNPDVRTNAEESSYRSGAGSTELPPTQLAGPIPPAPTTQRRRVGPYRLDSLIGSGGFGEVWLATREGELADTQLAVKLPYLNRVDVEAIRTEAKIWAQVASHPNILPIFEATVYDGQVVIASEYARDGSLAQWLKNQGGKAPTTEDAVRITLGVLAGLEHLHRFNVIHRDIKPANVLLQNGVPRLADFGLSRAMSADAQSEIPAGTPAFMAPEAFDGVRTFQTDIWSVGVLFYLLLAGSLPFPGRTWSSLFKSILTADPAPLPSGFAATYEGVLRACLEKNPNQRMQSASEMAARLQSLPSGSTASGTTLSGPTLVTVYDNQLDDPFFADWGMFSTANDYDERIGLIRTSNPSATQHPDTAYDDSMILLRLRVFADEQVGVNRAFPYLTGTARFEYQAVQSGALNPNLLFCVIPMQVDQADGENLIEVGARSCMEPENAYSPYRQRFFVPHGHIGDGQWHMAEIDFDFRSIPTADYSILAPRINEGCPRPGPGELLVRNVELLVPPDSTGGR